MWPTALAALMGCALAACGGEPAGDEPATPVAAEEAHRCLADVRGELDVQGPLRRRVDDTDAPDRTFVVSGRHASAYLGYYDDEARAQRSAPEQIEHARQFDGDVDRYGELTIIWVRGKATDEGSDIESCALD